MKLFLLCGVVCFSVLLAVAVAEDDQATEDQAPAEEQAPAVDDTAVVEEGDADAAATEDDTTPLSDPAAADQDLPAELFKAHRKSAKTAWKHFEGRSPYPPIHQGGRPTAQIPSAFKALRILKDHKKADSRFPKLKRVPSVKSFSCEKVHQAGFYADEDFDCQVFRRCDLNGGLTSYLCPVQTIFNQITLVCDWYFNVKCSRSKDFYDYSNSRLYHVDWPLLGDGKEGYGHGQEVEDHRGHGGFGGFDVNNEGKGNSYGNYGHGHSQSVHGYGNQHGHHHGSDYGGDEQTKPFEQNHHGGHNNVAVNDGHDQDVRK